MKGKSDNMIYPGMIGKTSVTGFMAHDPPSSKDYTLPIPISLPEAPFNQPSNQRRIVVVSDKRLGTSIDLPA